MLSYPEKYVKPKPHPLGFFFEHMLLKGIISISGDTEEFEKQLDNE